MSKCISCGKKVSTKHTKRCSSCATSFRFRKLKNIPAYIDGRTNKIYYCIDCNAKIGYVTWRDGTKRCLSCSKLGKRNPNHKHGKRCKNIKKYCIDCNKEISYKAKRCKSCATSGKLSNKFGKITHGKWEKYTNIWFRSSYEVAYAKYLDRLNIKWFYEKATFDLGNCTYTPDFYLPESDTFIEIKGFWRDDAKLKFNLFKKLYPELKIAVLNKNILEKRHILIK